MAEIKNRKLHNFSEREKVIELRPSGDRCSVKIAGMSILNEAINAGIKLPYGCAAGICGSCKCRLIEGEIMAMSNFSPTLTDEEIADRYILICQASAETNVVIEFPSDSALSGVEHKEFHGFIESRRFLTHDILEVSIALNDVVTFRPGQFMQVIVPGGGRARCYSFAHRPTRNGQKKISFFIRKVPGGLFTEKLFAGELDDTQLILIGPIGAFYLRGTGEPMICIAGGSGMAPLLSILEDAVKNRIERDCILLFGVRSERDIYGIDRLEKIARRWSGRFRYKIVLSDTDHVSAEGANSYLYGVVSDHIDAAIQELSFAPEKSHVYMAGPPPMIDSAFKVLVERGVGNENIYFDKFTDARDVG